MDYHQHAKRILDETTQNPNLPPPQERIDEPKHPLYPLRPEDVIAEPTAAEAAQERLRARAEMEDGYRLTGTIEFPDSARYLSESSSRHASPSRHDGDTDAGPRKARRSGVRSSNTPQPRG